MVLHMFGNHGLIQMFTFRQKVVLNNLIRGIQGDGNDLAPGSGE